MSHYDQLNRFLFEDYDLRGEIVSLKNSFQTVIENHNAPESVNRLLGEFMAAASLLSSVLKFDGTLTLQARGQGPLSLIMADCTRHKNLRAIAQLDSNKANDIDKSSPSSFQDLIGKGTLAITIDPANGERYQGIVPLESNSLAGCLEDYFRQSEQLATRFWLTAENGVAAGLLLQALPEQKHTDTENQDYWEHIVSLADTITPEEQINLSHQEQLHRLFHQENIRLFEAQEMAFHCSCSRDRTSSALISMGEQEIQSILNEQGKIEIDCHFCHQIYCYSQSDIDELFNPEGPTLH